MVEPIPEQIAWAAGIFEGEGCIHFQSVNCVSLTIHMTDEDILRRFAEVVGAGSIHPVHAPSRSGSKPIFRWDTANSRDVRRILEYLVPWFGVRRGLRATAALERLKNNLGRGESRTHCLRGHGFDGTNLIVMPDGRRRCRECAKLHKRRSYAKSKARV